MGLSPYFLCFSALLVVLHGLSASRIRCSRFSAGILAGCQGFSLVIQRSNCTDDQQQEPLVAEAVVDWSNSADQ